MYTNYSYLSYIDLGNCVICQTKVHGPFDFCGDCFKIYGEYRKTPWLRSLLTNAQKKRRQAKRDASVGLVSLDAIIEAQISDRMV